MPLESPFFQSNQALADARDSSESLSAVNRDLFYLTIQTPKPHKHGYSGVVSAPLINAFICGNENRAVKDLFEPSTVQSLLDRSPVYLYGPSGIGKTSIASTLAARWALDRAGRNCLVAHAGDFAKQWVRAIDADDMPRFRNLHRNVDCLLIDGIQDLSGKFGAQSELVETLNQIESRGGLVIATGQVLPALIAQLDPALTSRLVAGYSLELHFPSLAARFEIMKRIAIDLGANLSTNDLDRLILPSPDTAPASHLKGVLTRWLHFHKANEKEPTTSDTQKLIDAIAEAQSNAKPHPNEIVKAVGRELQQTMDQMVGQSRKASIVRARGLAMHLIRLWTDASFQTIGELFGGRDHTTVMHACKKVESELKIDPELARAAERIRQKLLK